MDVIEQLLEYQASLDTKSTKNKKLNLEGANLRGLNLTNFRLSGANLNFADLTGAKLDSADLQQINLSGADLTGVNLTRSDLTRANLTGANLTAVNLTEAILTRANLTGANLTAVNLTEAILTRSNLSGSNLAEADFTGSILSKVNLIDADLNGAIGYAPITEQAITVLLQVANAVLVDPLNTLRMEILHTCNTAHCAGGWVCHLNSVAKILESILGWNAAACLICPIPEFTGLFYATDSEMLEFLTSVHNDQGAEIRQKYNLV